nr:MAG TPA: Gemin6 6 [Caudoviricetes sp.]
MNLREYIGKNVKIVSISKSVWTGKASALDLAVNSDEMEYDELILETDNKKGTVVFPENEIKSIEVI